ncbi:MAG: Gx transporter family protein [Anaeroplasma sp.]|nr:Gx transporter family protein [Anaeroplasma sp.]
MTIKRLAIISMLTAMAMVLSILESFIPVFIPGVKLGLANVIILIMLYEFKPWEALMVDFLRIILVAIMRGTLLQPTFIMSFSGGMLSFFMMFIFSRFKIFSVIGVSVIGSISHCLGQIIAAMIILSTEAVIYYLPFIAILSLLTGVLSGCICKAYLKRSITQKFI